jgi:uncharacterized protein YgiM (DUF1202 family)
MKRNVWLVCGSMLCANIGLGQQATNAPAPVPADAPVTAPAQTAPAESSSDQKAATKKAPAKKTSSAATTKPKYDLHTTPLKPGPAIVVASNVNVRGQAKLNSEVIGRVTKGQQVTVLEEVTLKNSGPEEPSAWAKIVLPPNINGWIHSEFIDAATKAVKPRRLNVRSGPGENYSVIGRLERGENVKELRAQGPWIQIEPPTNAYAFVAAQYLKQEAEAPATVAAAPTAPTEVPATATTVPEQPAVAPPPTEPPAVAAATNATTETAGALANPASLVTTNAVEITDLDEPPPPRIVQREGVVRGTLSIQAPTKFELYSPETGRVINYLYSSARDLDLRRYKGLRIIVTGEEGLDERWRNTPVINIQRIQVLE